MPNEKNLKKYGQDKPALSHEEAVTLGKKGGKASGKARIVAKTSKEIVEMLDKLPLSGKDLDVLSGLGIPKELCSRHTLRLLQLQKKAEEGDVKANRLLLEMRGEDATNVNLDVNPEVKEAYDRAAEAIKRGQ